MNINEEGKYYASMVRKFRTEYKSKNLHVFCKDPKVSYTKHEIRREIHTGYQCAYAWRGSQQLLGCGHKSYVFFLKYYKEFIKFSSNGSKVTAYK